MAEEPSTVDNVAPAQGTTEETKTESEAKDIYASGFPASFDEEQFRQMFEKYCTRGTITNCRFRKHVVGSQTGYGFLTFSDKLDAEDAIKEMNGIELESEMVKVTDSSSPEYSQSSLNLYVEGVPKDWDEDKLKELFSPMGNITNVKILINRKTNEKTGVGFVHYSTQDEANKAIDQLHNTQLEGSDEKLTVRFARTMGRKRGPKNRGSRSYRGGFDMNYAMGAGGWQGGYFHPMSHMMYGAYGGYGGYGFGAYGRARGRGGGFYGGRGRRGGRGGQRSSYRPY